MNDLMGSLVPADTSVEELGHIWGDRGAGRRTRGTTQRTTTLATLDILAKECGIEECETLATNLADAWAGEEGWDTGQFIKALGAMRGRVTIVEPGVKPPMRGEP